MTYLQRLLAFPVLVLIGATAANADVLVVGPPAVGGAHATIQGAVDAAQDHDVIVVHATSSPGFTVDGKSLAIQRWPGRDVQVQGTITVRNLPAGGLVLIEGLTATGTGVFPVSQPALLLEANQGQVRVQDCALEGGAGTGSTSCFTFGEGGPGLQAQACAGVLLERCTVTGGIGGGDSIAGCRGARGGDGARLWSSTVGLYECTLRGGKGGTADTFGGAYAGDGGHGVAVESWGLFASGSAFHGGDGGWAEYGGEGGDGIVAVAGTFAVLLDSQTAGGLGGNGSPSGGPGPGGGPTSGAGSFLTLPGVAASLEAAALASDGDRLVVEVRGQPGSEVRLFTPARPALRWFQPWSGLAAFPQATPTTAQPIGVIPWSGRLLLEIPLPDQALATRPLFLQALVRPPSGPTVLSSPIVAMVLDAQGALPDCDGNGSSDLCDLLREELDDCNRDGVPDVCQAAATTWHVDPAAAAGGNGSPAQPFQTLKQAIAAAQSCDTILLADGVYSGPENRKLGIVNRSLTLRSSGGPSAAILDIEQQGRALWIEGTGDVRIEGLTFLDASETSIMGLLLGRLEIVDCVFESCSGNEGGALFAASLATRVEGCRFWGNQDFARGGAIRAEGAGDLVIVDCRFESNSAGLGGAITLLGGAGGNRLVSGCAFLGNSALSDGGAIHATLYGNLSVESCLFAGNTSERGGGVFVEGWDPTGASRLSLGLSTLIANEAGTAGGNVFLARRTSGGSTGLQAQVFDAILWSGQSPSGEQLAIGTDGVTLEVLHSDLQGGQLALAVAQGAVLLWGAGNIDQDPLFADPDGPDNDPTTLADNDYRLAAGSPCIDAGSNPAIPQDVADLDADRHVAELTPFDLDGLSRRSDDPATPDTGVGPAPVVDMGAYEKP